jgi:hypothetical protein
MSAASKRKSAAQAKAGRQKKIAIVGGVLLLAVIGFQAPKLLHHGSSAPPVATDASGLIPQTSAPASLADASPPVAGPGQLVSFSLFKAKDPFVQQIVESTNGSGDGIPAPTAPLPTTPVATTGTGAAPTPTTPAPGPPTLTQLPPAPPSPTSTAPSTAPTATAPAAPTSASIETNGACEAITLGNTFPVDTPFFQLASIAQDGKSVQIGISGGSLQSGQPTVTLKKGTPLTLVNTTDGVRYDLNLVDACPLLPVTPGGTSPATTIPVTTTAVTTTAVTTTAATTTTSSSSSPTDVATEANIRTIVPSIEAYYADNGTYAGMTLARLKLLYDPALDTSKYLLKTATATSYCVQSPASGGNPYSKNGPAAAIVQGRCP